MKHLADKGAALAQKRTSAYRLQRTACGKWVRLRNATATPAGVKCSACRAKE